MAVIYDIDSAQCEHILVKTRQFVRKCKGCKKFKWPWSKAVGCIKCMKVWHRRCQPLVAGLTSTTIVQDTVPPGTTLQACVPQNISGGDDAVINEELVMVANSSKFVVITTACTGRFSEYCHRPLGLRRPTAVTWTFFDMSIELSGHVLLAHPQLQHLLPAFGHPTNLLVLKNAVTSLNTADRATHRTSATADVVQSVTAVVTTPTQNNTKSSRCRRENCKNRRCIKRKLDAEAINFNNENNTNSSGTLDNSSNLLEFKNAVPSSSTANHSSWTSAIADVAPPSTTPLATAVVAAQTTNNTKSSRCRRINCKSRRCRKRQLLAELEQPQQ